MSIDHFLAPFSLAGLLVAITIVLVAFIEVGFRFGVAHRHGQSGGCIFSCHDTNHRSLSATDEHV